MSMRVCAEAGCPTLTTTTRCSAHARAKDRERGTPAERGYGAEHRAMRKRYQSYMDTGVIINCWRCHKPIAPDAPWDLGHDDVDRTKWRGPECRPCNRATASRYNN